MRLALIGRYFNRQGGVSRCLAELADRAALEHEVDVYAHEVLDRGACSATFVPIAMLERVPWLQIATFNHGVQRRLRRERYDLIHVEDSQAVRGDVYTAHSCAAAWLRQARADAGVRGMLSRVYPPHVSAELNERRCLVRGDSTVIAVSKRVGWELETFLGIDPARIRVVYNGVDTEVFAPADSRAGARARLDEADRPVREDAIVLLFIGYYFHRKGLAQLLRALARTAAPRAELWVLGGDDPAPYAALARELGVAERVRFLGHRADAQRYLQAADALVLPTRYEPFGLVILEALACGTPVVTARTAGAAELVEDRPAGLLLDDPWDVDELTDALRRLLAAEHRWPEMAVDARRAATPWSWEGNWRRTAAVYAERLERASGRG